MIQTGNRNFWIAQLLGWGIFALVNFLVQFATVSASGKLAESLWLIFLNSSIAFVSGIAVTTGYRYFIKKRDLNLLKIWNTVAYICLSTLIMTFLFLVIISILYMVLVEFRMLAGLELLGNAFIFGILLLIWNSLYFMIHYLHSWKNAESEKWQLAASVKEAQLGNLKAQINPHFIFNAINNIRALISEDPEKAKHMLLNFSDMFRYSLIHSDQSLVAIREELEIVEKYLELLSIQFEEKLSYRINVDDSLLDDLIPPMIIQLLVENAVKHGISDLEGGGVVEVNVASEKDTMLLLVRNTGNINGQKSLQQKLGVGLKNIHERLRLIYGPAGTFELNQDGEFVHAKVSYPKGRAI